MRKQKVFFRHKTFISPYGNFLFVPYPLPIDCLFDINRYVWDSRQTPVKKRIGHKLKIGKIDI